MTTGEKFLNLLFAPLILIAAVAVIVVLVKSRQTPPAKIPVRAVPRLEVIESSPADAVPTVSTYGNGRSYFETTIASQVSGRIESVSTDFDAGRALKEGEVLAKIEEADFKVILSEREAALAAVKQTLAAEETRSRIAREDWQASGRKIEDAPDFTLRIPQLTAAKASVAAAEGGLENALLDLQRTEIRAPFDAIVQTRTASPGNVVSTGATLGTLISRDKAEVRLPLTPEQVARLDLPLAFVSGSGSPVHATLRSTSRPGVQWDAVINRTEAAVDERNQVLYVIAEIPHPFENAAAFLPVGAFVTDQLKGKSLKNVHRLPDVALVDDEYVWIVDPNDKLSRQPVERLFSEKGSFLARIESPLAALPLRVVTRPLASFREGTEVKIAEPTPDIEKP
jgi:RND family efflux transporter MFP subunit